MKRLKFLANCFLTVLTGAIATSLWITYSDHWKFYLPIFLLTLVLKITIEDARQ